VNIRPDLLFYGKMVQHRFLLAGQVEVTSDCNQHCKGCDSWRDHQSGKLRAAWSAQAMQRLCAELAESGTFEHLSLTGGDPEAWPPLDAFLEWFDRDLGHPFQLQINTALAAPVSAGRAILYREAVDDLRVSFDSVSPEIYARVRGDLKTTPEQIIGRIEDIAHPRWAANVTAYKENINAIPATLRALAQLDPAPRKIMVMAGIGARAGKDLDFWARFEHLSHVKWEAETSFEESALTVRRWMEDKGSEDVACYAGRSTFHLKANGEVYPCCLVGGEALETRGEFSLGNFVENHEYSLKRILDRSTPQKHYANPALPCKEICQYKQAALNVVTSWAVKQNLAMP